MQTVLNVSQFRPEAVFLMLKRNNKFVQRVGLSTIFPQKNHNSSRAMPTLDEKALQEAYDKARPLVVPGVDTSGWMAIFAPTTQCEYLVQNKVDNKNKTALVLPLRSYSLRKDPKFVALISEFGKEILFGSDFPEVCDVKEGTLIYGPPNSETVA